MVKQRLMLWIQSIAGGLAGALGLLTVVWPRLNSGGLRC